ncbi:vomeromodulin [Cricetulus griseus]|uniref:Vomeromodulin n=1 Tax=Cricetulus griseus TaxID=10029 RepID=A0A061HXX5_CRIGR|nr:vomeromodulin [Cricetulus griseus]
MWALWALVIALSIQAGTLDLVETPPVVSSLPVAVPNGSPLPLSLPTSPHHKSSSSSQGSPIKKHPAASKGGKCAPAARYFLSSGKLHDSTGLFKYWVQSARISPKGLAILYCMNGLDANITKIAYAFQKDKQLRISYEAAITKDSEDFATGKTQLIISHGSKITKAKLEPNIKLIRYVPVIPDLSKTFIIKGCWILSKAFSASSEMIM